MTVDKRKMPVYARATPSRAPARRVKWRGILTAYAFLIPYLFFFAAFQLVPTVFGITMAGFKWELLEGTRKFVGLANFRFLAEDPIFRVSLRNSAYFAVITTIGSTTVSLAAALALRRITGGQTFFRTSLYIPVLLSVSAVGITWGRVLNTNGLINYYLSLVGLKDVRFLGDAALVLPSLSLATIWWRFGFPMLIFLSGLYGIPQSLYEAAQIDGAGTWQSFTRLTLPLLRPALLLVLVTEFLVHMQFFGLPYMITQGGPGRASYPVSYYLYQTGWRYYHMGYASSMAVTLAVIMLAVTLTQFRLLGQRVEY